MRYEARFVSGVPSTFVVGAVHVASRMPASAAVWVSVRPESATATARRLRPRMARPRESIEPPSRELASLVLGICTGSAQRKVVGRGAQRLEIATVDDGAQQRHRRRADTRRDARLTLAMRRS